MRRGLSRLYMGDIFVGQGHNMPRGFDFRECLKRVPHNISLHVGIIGFAGIGAHGHARCGCPRCSVLAHNRWQGGYQYRRNPRFLDRPLHNGSRAVTGASAGRHDDGVHLFFV